MRAMPKADIGATESTIAAHITKAVDLTLRECAEIAKLEKRLVPVTEDGEIDCDFWSPLAHRLNLACGDSVYSSLFDEITEYARKNPETPWGRFTFDEGSLLVEGKGEPTLFQRPPAEVVAKRALCLTAIVLRYNAESLFRRTGHDTKTEAVSWWKDVRRTIDKHGLRDGFTQSEFELVARDLGSWSRQEVINGSWRIEAAGVLLWALGHVPEMPAYNDLFDCMVSADYPETTKNGAFESFVVKTIASPALIDEALTDAAYTSVHDMAWVIRDHDLYTEKVSKRNPKDKGSYKTYLELRGEIPVAEEGQQKKEPLFDGKPYRRLSKSEKDKVSSVVQERFLSLSWLAHGFGSLMPEEEPAWDWDNTCCDT